MGISKDIAQDLFRIQKLSSRDKEQINSLIIDFFAAAYAGYKLNRSLNLPLERVMLSTKVGKESYVLFKNDKYPVRTAAFMNAIYGHGAELDDGNKKAAGHAGVHLIPAVFALADKIGSSNDDVLIALATGYEAYIRISSAAMPGMVKRGFHSTGMTGTLACAAACARLYHLDAPGIENAISLATTMTGGLLSYGDSHPEVKPLNPAKAAENGIFAAMLANEGVKGPREALEGPNGWFHAVTDSYDSEMLRGAEDGQLLLHDCYIKQYPSCRHTHCGIDAGISLHKKVHYSKIEKVEVYIYPNAIKLAGIKYPNSQDETKFSIYYTLACSLVNGKYGISDMIASEMSKEVKEFIGKIELIPDESMEDRSKGIRGTRIIVYLKNGKFYEETVLTPKGDPENPLAKDEVIEKLRTCSEGLADEAELARIINAIEKINETGRFENPMSFIGE